LFLLSKNGITNWNLNKSISFQKETMINPRFQAAHGIETMLRIFLLQAFQLV